MKAYEAFGQTNVGSRGWIMRADGSSSRRRLRVHVVDGAAARAARAVSRSGSSGSLLAPPREVDGRDRERPRMRALNRCSGGMDRATDVLSFPAGPAPRGGQCVVAAQACSADRPPHRRTRQAISATSSSHAVLHAVRRDPSAMPRRRSARAGVARPAASHGYDHERDAGRMQRVERRLRQAGGLATGLIEREVRR